MRGKAGKNISEFHIFDVPKENKMKRKVLLRIINGGHLFFENMK